MLLEHLIDFEPEALDGFDAVQSLTEASDAEILAAQLTTTEWLERVGAPNLSETQRAVARIDAQNAFAALTAPASDVTPAVTSKLLSIKTPVAVRHLVGMLTAYDWEFVEQAKELRGYAVAKIVEETKHPDAKIRLRALDMLGKVTEVALFTERIEVKRTELSDHELDAKIKEKLARFTGVVDVTSKDVTDV